MRKQIVCSRFNDVSHLEGDVMELGVAYGYTLFPLSLLAKNKTVYALDTFDGLPYDDAIVSPDMCKQGEIRAGDLDGVFGHYGDYFFRELPKYSNVIALKGLIEETLPTLSDKKFCFVWLDLDLYQPTSFAAKWLKDRLVVGGMMGFHDYKFPRCPGISRVVDNEIDMTKFEISYNEATCIFFKKVR